MPLPAAAAYGIATGAAAALGAGTSIYNFSGNRKVQAQNRSFAAEMSLLDYQRSIENWNRMNEYNLPSAQMQRLKDAGLNTALMYGQGTVGNAEMPNQPDMAKHESRFLPFDVNPVITAAVTATNLRKTNQEIENLKTTGEILEADAYGKDLANDLTAHMLPFQKDLLPKQLKATLRKTWKEMQGIDSTIKKQKFETMWNELKVKVWNKYKINIDRDNINHRSLWQILRMVGSDVKSMGDGTYKHERNPRRAPSLPKYINTPNN